MLVNLLASSNKGSFNISIAQIFGLKVAVYIDAVINVIEKAYRKKRIKDGFIYLDREYIGRMTTVTIEEQLEFDKLLETIGVLYKKPDGALNLDLIELSNLLMSDNESLTIDIKDIANKIHKRRKVSKEETTAERLKACITTSNEELRTAYSQWIDSVISKDGWMSSTSVMWGEQIVDAASNHNLDVALTIIKLASLNGYRDMNWAVERFKTNANSIYTNVKNNIDYTNSEIMEVF